ncbi:hypothetical protein EVAR_59091_1 [Eumeta japonica]|uniref:Uncharacterized protein n=1 Tax=Eumeta variegata TaxID=151549 RepID=A0A4C1YVU1_EUMVA|nr:hypothetical protein EVAR_59091_1 [Eumeta japonica]
MLIIYQQRCKTSFTITSFRKSSLHTKWVPYNLIDEQKDHRTWTGSGIGLKTGRGTELMAKTGADETGVKTERGTNELFLFYKIWRDYLPTASSKLELRSKGIVTSKVARASGAPTRDTAVPALMMVIRKLRRVLQIPGGSTGPVLNTAARGRGAARACIIHGAAAVSLRSLSAM